MNQAENLYMNPVQDNEKDTDINFKKLFNSNYKNLSRFIGKRVTHKEDAEDILQSTIWIYPSVLYARDCFEPGKY